MTQEQIALAAELLGMDPPQAADRAYDVRDGIVGVSSTVDSVGSVLVGPDLSVLYFARYIAPEQALAVWDSGRRTPREAFAELHRPRAWTGRPLRLPAPPDPQHAAELAQHAVESARAINEVEFDYTPASLKHVDATLEAFRTEGSDVMAEAIFVLGCYLGEVLVRHAGYEWVETPTGLAANLGLLTVHRADTDTHANPIWKAFKRVDNGDTESVVGFYRLASE